MFIYFDSEKMCKLFWETCLWYFRQHFIKLLIRTQIIKLLVQRFERQSRDILDLIIRTHRHKWLWNTCFYSFAYHYREVKLDISNPQKQHCSETLDSCTKGAQLPFTKWDYSHSVRNPLFTLSSFMQTSWKLWLKSSGWNYTWMHTILENWLDNWMLLCSDHNHHYRK